VEHTLDIAIIGMSGRFPQAPTIDIFWRNLCDAREGVCTLSDSQLLAAGVDPKLLADPRYVKAAANLSGVDLFDASFFGFSPREAEILDPQHRIFLQTAWHALESAGYVPDSFRGPIGLFAGAGFPHYMLAVLSADPEIIAAADSFQTLISNDKDFLSTRVSYKLDLRGPSIAVQTACSTSLVAVHLACQSLLSGECDIALAGGISIAVPQDVGYLYQEGGILSSDGRCRAFDAQASGVIGGSGVGLVVLKRLAEARADGDNVHAVIKGSAVNNDGFGKVGFTAPSISGQTRVIKEAQAIAGVDPATITYVETHGTGTALGDPIEIAALTQAFKTAADRRGFCAIGSVKTNIGHLDTAAGVAGLIKTTMALKHRQIPPSLYFERPNPQIDFANSPFYVNTELSAWEANGTPRRAGVSSFGIGGTNAHLILEEAAEAEPSAAAEGWQLLTLSARSDDTLSKMAARLGEHLKQHPELNLADVAYTLQEGRKAFDHRLVVVCRTLSEAIASLETEQSGGRRAYRARAGEQATPVVFMFPGQGVQYVGMGRELYEQEPEYRSVLDRCAELMKKESGVDLRGALYPSQGEGAVEEGQVADLIDQTWMTQMALFAVELGLARMWQSKGVQPVAMIGHSLGEYAAGCLAGVLAEEQAIRLIAKRGALMQEARPGAMLAVALSESELREILQKAGSHLDVAAINGPEQCVVSGGPAEIDEFEGRLNELGIAARRLKTSHAFHSRMMEGILGRYRREVDKVSLKRPEIRYISNVTGGWIRAEEARDAGYWSRQMREPVRYWEGLEQIGRSFEDRVLLEVGPGSTLSRIGGRLNGAGRQGVAATLGDETEGSAQAVMEAVGKLWSHGVEINWEKWRKGNQKRVELPGYPFEESRYWLGGARQRPLSRKMDVREWFYVPVWIETPFVIGGEEPKAAQRWLILEDEEGIGEQIAAELGRRKCIVTRVKKAEQFLRNAEREYWIRAEKAEDYQAVLKELHERGESPDKVVHLFNLSYEDAVKAQDWEMRIEEAKKTGFYSLVYLAQGISRAEGMHGVELIVISNGAVEARGDEELRAEKAILIGLVRVMEQESPQLRSRYIDLTPPPPSSRQREKLIRHLINDLSAESAHQVTAYRGTRRWAQTYNAARLPSRPAGDGLRSEGVYLITGGLGKIGMALAEYLARNVRAKLALIGRRGLPDRGEWDRLLAETETDEWVREKITQVKALKELGGEVEVIRADVSNEDEMRAAARVISRRFGSINGVIHAAGITGGDSIRLIQEITPANCNSLFRPKVQGSATLEKIFKDANLDFCLLFSSLSSILGGLGFAAYSGSNFFMDTFVTELNRVSPAPWISVNWDGWRFGQDNDPRNANPGSPEVGLTINPEEGVQVFQQIISAKVAGQIVVSTGDLHARIRKWIDLASLRGGQQPQQGAVRSGYARPQLKTTYVAPRNDLERSVAAIWQDLLGIEQIGAHDNFFELGGHSLLATQCSSRLRQAFKVEISLRSLFEKPTVAEQGEIIEEALIEEMEALTDEEVASRQNEL
jgi:acyl transferase domain-containing protein